MPLLSVRNLTYGFGGPPLLEDLTFHIDAGERVALVGRNGAGKSTLLRLIAGAIDADGGSVQLASGARVARLMQEVPREVVGDVFDVVAGGLAEAGRLLTEYHRLSAAAGTADSAGILEQLETVQTRLEAVGGWHLEQRVETVLSRLELPADDPFDQLSGGMQRRVLLARALVAEPDLLLLDEPTNHLDLPAIEWLEDQLPKVAASLLFVTHDRAFLRKLATRILEIDRAKLTDWPGDYRKYLERREAQLAAEARADERFDAKLAREEVWIRQGIKARRTRNEGRVRALERLRAERRSRRGTVGEANLRLESAPRSGKIVIEAEGIHHAFDDRALIRDFSTKILRGDKVGLLGANGSGKTTLLRILLGELEPDQGSVRHGTRLELAYFDQHREQLDENKTVADSIADGNDQVEIDGKQRHVISYLESFLFEPKRARSPVKSLSGGERNRLLLARLFTRPANLLVMDEPTNDLDIETLELLESLLVELKGTLILVSHDRAFLDNVVTSTLVMEGHGRVGDYAGGYSDWLEQRPSEPTAVATARPAAKKAAPPSERQKTRKLSYRETQDLESLPARIEALEAEQAELHSTLADPETYKSGHASVVTEAKDRLTTLGAELETAYDRWTELESLTS